MHNNLLHPRVRTWHTVLSGAFLILLLIPSGSSAEAPVQDEKEKPLMELDFESGVTTIQSESLLLKANQREFTYQKNVVVKKDDMTLTCGQLDGAYDETNQITELEATQDVVIVQGTGVKAKGNRAVYDKALETLTLTENPEVEQNGSILSADKITLFLKEDRSTAEGAVKVKLIEEAKEGKKEAPPKQNANLLGR